MPKAPIPRDEEERIALVALRFAKILMESGSSARIVHEGAQMVVKGLGADYLGLRTGYASLAITVGNGQNTLSRMVEIGRMGVNHRLDHAVRRLAARIAAGGYTPQQADDLLTRLQRRTPRHPAWFVALAVGLACASFGRLFGMDWPSFPFVWIASAAAQYLRHLLFHRGMNAFVVSAVIAFASSIMAGLGAKAGGSETVGLAMMASILLLVPGVPATNAQSDIMDGYPTLGSARAVSVAMIMVFATVGIWIAQTILGVH